MSSLERQIAELENESKSLNVAFSRSAVNIPIYTKEISIKTTENALTITNPGGSQSKTSDQERVLLTFNTFSGANTYAKLEMKLSNPILPIVRQNTYSGGAQWVITNSPNFNSSGGWQSTNYTFAVQSFVDGELTVKEISS